MIRIAAIIPAYNEEKSIVKVVRSIKEIQNSTFVIDPIVVNDSSNDNTSKIIHSLPCVSLDLPINLGIGGAVQTGFIYAYENNYDYAIQVDGDGQHPADQIEKLFLLIHNQSNVVIGSRFIENEGFQSTKLRRLGIKYFMLLNKVILNVKITDCTSGFRMIDRKALKIVCDYYPDEYPEPESIVLFSLNNLRMVEAPVVMKERQGGVSSINFVSSIYYMIKVTLAIFYTFIRIKFRRK
ncbi:glycosyltransferase family 2 protein [Aquimarina sp. SS2-1]|uniref:glycosyltransferase family 2 protein n=1 Tax=Aquimarina besae TaxID=3342247 RepID=UPI00366EA4E9